MRLGWRIAMVGMGLLLGGAAMWGQAAAMPSMQVGTSADEAGRGRALMDEMVKALGGDAWVHRETWLVRGRMAKFYKGEADAGAPGFEEYGRRKPFGERLVVVSHYGALVAMDHRDVAQVWTGDRGWEITYKGAAPLGAAEVEEFERRKAHSLDVVVGEWLPEKDAVVTYEGAKMVDREMVEAVSVVRGDGDAVEVMLDARTHLPVSVSWRWRDAEFRDWDTDAVEFGDYHEVQGVMTAYSVVRRKNGDRVEERFVTSVRYNVALGAEVFEPKAWVEKKK